MREKTREKTKQKECLDSVLKEKRVVLSDRQRLEIALEYLEGHSSFRSLGEKYGLSANTIWRSVHTFVEENPTKAALLKQQKAHNEEDELTRLRREVKELKAQLEYEHLRATAYDTMIDIAEEKFNIPIRKKAGTKR